MRFHADGPSIPDRLLERCDAGRVVFLCGAGVSIPLGMPDFVELTEHVINHLDPPEDSEIIRAFRPWLEEASAANVPLDQIFNLVHQEYGRNEVNRLVTERLAVPSTAKQISRKHENIKRISSSPDGVPQVVTTNFDRLFELGSDGAALPCHVAPALPDIQFGSSIEGITYLHGRLVEPDAREHPYVLSSADFGRAYLSEGWATRFIRHLLRRYTVVLVGYKAEDPPIRYLLQGLNHDGRANSSRLFAFDRGRPEDIEAKWRDRGVTAIAYADHDVLWRTLEAWAERADDPRKWRANIISMAAGDPKEIAPHERGQVAHVLRTAPGAKAFAEAEPVPHPEWICVMDATIRSANAVTTSEWEAKLYGREQESFDPRQAYGLDDDLPEISDDLLFWREGDDNPTDLHRLTAWNADRASIPKRLAHLASWIGKSLNSPVLAWWAIRQSGLHPRVLWEIEWRLDRGDIENERARHVWRLILEYHRAAADHDWNDGWYAFKRRLQREGWTKGVLRAFRQITSPRLNIELPRFGVHSVKPPSSSWEDIQLRDLGEFKIKFPYRLAALKVPDEALPDIVALLQEQLMIAAGLLLDVEDEIFPPPIFYWGREMEGERHASSPPTEVTEWFVQLFDRLAELRPDLARAHAMCWPPEERFIFRKLKLYALNKKPLFKAEEVAEALLALNQQAFWDTMAERELLFLLVDRWREFKAEHKRHLMDRILSDPDRLPLWSDKDYARIRKEHAAIRARYLELKGCRLPKAHCQQLAELIRSLPEWRDSWAEHATTPPFTSHTDWVRIDESPDDITHLPVNEIIPAALEKMERGSGEFDEKRPFTGLVKSNPRKALAALSAAARAGNYPQALWAALIDELPDDISPRLKRAFLHRLARLPKPIIANLGHPLGEWLKRNLKAILEFDAELGWAVFDHVVEGLFSSGAEATESGLGEFHQGGEVIRRSRRTFQHAINGPVGMCAEALFNAMPAEQLQEGTGLPESFKSRLERLLQAPGKGADHAVSITAVRLNWLLHIDPEWTKERWLPMLVLEHPAAEPAWNGLLYSRYLPGAELVKLIKPQLIRLFPWIEQFAWDDHSVERAATMLGYLRIFHPDKPSGLTEKEMRSLLRGMSDNTRNRFIWELAQVGRKNKNGWTELVVPFLKNIWPRERQFRTTASVQAWMHLLGDSDDAFPAVYEAVKGFLISVPLDRLSFYRFIREGDDEEPITARFPEETLDLMDRITPDELTWPSHDLKEILELISKAEPALTSDPRYLRLIDLIERS